MSKVNWKHLHDIEPPVYTLILLAYRDINGDNQTTVSLKEKKRNQNTSEIVTSFYDVDHEITIPINRVIAWAHIPKYEEK